MLVYTLQNILYGNNKFSIHQITWQQVRVKYQNMLIELCNYFDLSTQPLHFASISKAASQTQLSVGTVCSFEYYIPTVMSTYVQAKHA